MLQPAAAKMADWAEVAAVQVTDPAEQELVARYDLSRTPLPLVMAIAPCGAITKAFTGQFTEAQLETAYVSPCTVLLAPPGSVIGQFDGRATKQQIVAKLVAAQNNPCAGGKCGPNGCGPKK